ncbi:hypothetical protein NM208_g9229 [Fusarium decemcellulare]|uniref:Uncharacterized protein n=1 Tax=Fusarium decemcellulare TaxID=57161 RepID=A0ACC1S2J4_9HYPO|nr:hypothetical protein NM208_g9229 [Fusarium decemcellulare]
MLDDRNVAGNQALEPFALWKTADNLTGWTAVLGEERGRDNVSGYIAAARTQDVEGLPRTYIDVGGLDIFRDEALSYSQRLAKSNIETEIHVYPGLPHGFELFGSQAPVVAKGSKFNPQMSTTTDDGIVIKDLGTLNLTGLFIHPNHPIRSRSDYLKFTTTLKTMATDQFTSRRQESRNIIEIKAYGPVPLACAACRYRKSKCDRARPTCGRCVKFGIDCIYPGSRKPPVRKQRNVEELEDRLAQVEDRVNKVSQSIAKKCRSKGSGENGEPTGRIHSASPGSDAPSMTLKNALPLPLQGIIECLTEAFFRLPYSDMKIIHPIRYMRAFRGDTTLKPPVFLQYAICALAAIGITEYDNHNVFYLRARQCLEADETKGNDEQHVSIHHAQAWVLISLYEDKAMLFTRSIMSIARSRQICHLMSLDLLDEEHDSIDPEPSPLSWIELEERRRVFWCSFVLDAITSISTGLSSLIDLDDIVVRLPASDDAFVSGIREEAPFLHTILEGAQPAGFAGIVILCQMFKEILRHMVQSSRTNTKGTVDNTFWFRHHELDEQMSRISKLLEQNFYSPPDSQNKPFIRINLTLQASIICLHHAAIKECEKYESSQILARASIDRLQNAAEKALDIIKSFSDSAQIFENTLCSLSLYLVATAFVLMAKHLSPYAIRDLGTVVSIMENISPTHKITRAFLHRVYFDIKHSGVGAYIHLPGVGTSATPANQATAVSSSDSLDTHSTTSQHAQTSGAKLRNVAAWAVEEDAGALIWDCFTAILSAAKHNISAPGKMIAPNGGPDQTSFLGHESITVNNTIETASGQGPAAVGTALINANEQLQDPPYQNTSTLEGLIVPDDPLTWTASWEVQDPDSEWVFDNTLYAGPTDLYGMNAPEE